MQVGGTEGCGGGWCAGLGGTEGPAEPNKQPPGADCPQGRPGESTEDAPLVATRPLPPRASPLQSGHALMPAGPPGGEACTGLPGPVALPGVLVALAAGLGVTAILGLGGPGWEGGDLEAVVKDAESKLAVALWQRKQVLVHVLQRRRGEKRAATGLVGDAGPGRPHSPRRAAGCSGLQGHRTGRRCCRSSWGTRACQPPQLPTLSAGSPVARAPSVTWSLPEAPR